MVKPYYDEGGITIYCGDCREVMRGDIFGLCDSHGEVVDAVVTDPPYGDTSLAWDVRVTDWLGLIGAPQLWCFGSLRSWFAGGPDFQDEGWKLGQEIVWEKHNGSSFHADRFKRVHELVVHWYRGEWRALYKEPPVTFDATPRTVRRKRRPPHTGHIEASAYTSEDGGPRLMRSVLQVPSCHGHAAHPTQKPLGILRPLIEYSVPMGGMVLDPFMGAGSTLVAAYELGRRAIGIEVDEHYCQVAVDRLAQGVLAA